MAFLLGRVVTHQVGHGVLDYAQRQQELQQEQRQAQQLSQPEEPMSPSMVAHEMAIPPVNAPDVSYTGRAVAGGGAQHTTRTEARESNTRSDDSSVDPGLLSDLRGQTLAQVCRAFVPLVAGFVCTGLIISLLHWEVDNIDPAWRWVWWVWFLSCWYLCSAYM